MLPSYRSALLITSAIVLAIAATPAQAASVADEIRQLRDSLTVQQEMIATQKRLLEQQQAQLEAQQKEISNHRDRLATLGTLSADEMARTRATGEKNKTSSTTTAKEKISAAPVSAAENDAYNKSKQHKVAAAANEDAEDVGEPTMPTDDMAVYFARGGENVRPEINALPDTGGVLTPKGTLMYEQSFDYSNTSNNVFTFQGVQVAEVVLVGVINATSSRRQVVQTSSRVRLGLTDRMEMDVRMPLAYRNDATTTTNSGVTTKKTVEGHGFGDIDAGLSYQLNQGQDGWPFLVGNLRYKHDNAKGPFEVPFNSSNIATELPTGSGFKSVEASVTAINVSDPAVMFANIGYVLNISEDVNKTFGSTRITTVDPGDAINASLGMGFSINPETSFTLGYKHSYVFGTKQDSVNTGTGVTSSTESDTLQVGAMTVGLSYRFSPITSFNFNVEVGATDDAPDVRVGLRVPVRLGQIF
jgi:hypothetical protein